MNTMIKHPSLIAALAAVVLIAGGCRQEAKDTPKQKSSLATFRDGMTGKTAIEAGRKAQDKITAISEKRNADIESVLDD